MNQALDRVQDSYAAQAEFAGNVAHELRTPLTTIACRVEEIDDPTLRRKMTASVHHAVHVIDQLMMLARLGEDPELSSLDLRSLTLEALEQVAPSIIAKGRTIELDDEVADLDLKVTGNEGLARMSIDNLIDNAQRHTPPGTHIRVRLASGPQLLVEDNGPGIAPNHRQRVSNRHWRADERSSDGAGLGLSIVSKAMRAQHGSLEVCDTAKGARIALNFASPPPRQADVQLDGKGRDEMNRQLDKQRGSAELHPVTP
jgi:signal transduction histidine kinase